MSDHRPHTLVVGGGVIGIACAHYLNQAGGRVTVIDRGEIRAACSHGNCGLVCPSHVLPLAEPGAWREAVKAMFAPGRAFRIRPRVDPALWRWLWRFWGRCNQQDMLQSGRAIQPLLASSMQLYHQLVQDDVVQCEWQKRGLLFAYRNNRPFEAYGAVNELLAAEFNEPALRLTGDELLEFDSALKSGLAGGWYFEHDAHLRPDRLINSWRSRLEQGGVRFLARQELRDFDASGRSVRAARVPAGSIEADHFVVATGAWTPQLSGILGVRIPIEPGKGYSITLPRPPACPKIPMIFPEHRVALTPMESGLRLGSIMEFVGYDSRILPQRLRLLTDGASAYLREPIPPSQSDQWYGWRPMTYDSTPVIDRCPGLSNVYLATGHNMLGLSMAPATGRIIAELITNVRPHLDVSMYSATRFGGRAQLDPCLLTSAFRKLERIHRDAPTTLLLEKLADTPSKRKSNVELDFRKAPDILADIVDAMAVGVFTVDAAGNFVSWSAGAERITGFSAEHVSGKPCTLLEGPNCKGFGSLKELLAAPAPAVPGICNQECKVMGQDGREIYIHGSLRLIRDEQERIAGAVGSFTDVTSLVLANEKIAILAKQSTTGYSFEQLIGNSARMREVFRQLKLAADSDVTVLIQGESGTGKELAARAIHRQSRRCDMPFLAINCSAISEDLLESELFGHLKGAFTGATSDKLGMFEAADGGTLFLDEIGDVSPAIQVKLLRVLQEREIRRVGDTRSRGIDVRVVTATNRDLHQLVADGKIREDFFYRIHVFEIEMPPLRDRKDDIPLLVEQFVRELSETRQSPIDGVAKDTLDVLVDYHWPGNVRQLRNAIERASVAVMGDKITFLDLPPDIRDPKGRKSRASRQLSEAEAAERNRIIEALRQTGGNRTKAAELLGTSRVTLWKKIGRYEIQVE